MTQDRYTISPGFQPNPVGQAARAFLATAEMECKRKTAITGFLSFQEWHFTHHLAVIASELFLKAFKVTVDHGPVRSEDGPDDEEFSAAFKEHRTQLNKLPQSTQEALEQYLPRDLHDLIHTLSNGEIARGRYPYETRHGTTRFPSGDEGRKLALRWLKLARALSTLPPKHIAF